MKARPSVCVWVCMGVCNMCVQHAENMRKKFQTVTYIVKNAFHCCSPATKFNFNSSWERKPHSKLVPCHISLIGISSKIKTHCYLFCRESCFRHRLLLLLLLICIVFFWNFSRFNCSWARPIRSSMESTGTTVQLGAVVQCRITYFIFFFGMMQTWFSNYLFGGKLTGFHCWFYNMISSI